MYKNNQSYKIQNALKLYRETICLPSSYHLKDKDFKRVIKVLSENNTESINKKGK